MWQALVVRANACHAEAKRYGFTGTPSAEGCTELTCHPLLVLISVVLAVCCPEVSAATLGNAVCISAELAQAGTLATL